MKLQDRQQIIDALAGVITGHFSEVQVRDLARANGVFLREVLTGGLLIVNRDPAVRAELMIRMADFTEDMLPAVRRIGAANTERFLAGADDGRS